MDRKHIASINNSEMRITLTNGSFIKCDGSDNYESYRGIEPHFVVYEEFKDFRPEWHQAMEPNLLVHNAPLLIIGTPPEIDGQFTVMAAEARADPEKFFIEAPSLDNPHVSKEWLYKKRDALIAKGELDVWLREYCGKYVKGGSNKIFPMLSEEIKKPHDEVLRLIERDKKKLWKCVMSDPAGSSCFAVLVAMINPYTRMIYLIDELYEKRQTYMTVNHVGQFITRTMDDLYIPRGEDDGWHLGYDEAATWFANEMRDHFQLNLTPTQKSLKKKEEGLSLIKDILLQGKLVMSDRCVHTFWELDNYMKINGKIPKENDHEIDNFRYILGAYMYDLNPAEDPEFKEVKDENFRSARISDDFPELDDFGKLNEFDEQIIW